MSRSSSLVSRLYLPVAGANGLLKSAVNARTRALPPHLQSEHLPEQQQQHLPQQPQHQGRSGANAAKETEARSLFTPTSLLEAAYQASVTSGGDFMEAASLSLSRFLRDFVIVRWIGHGAFGHVCEVRNRTDSQLYAIKIVPVARDDNPDTVCSESRTMAQLPAHNNVVRYFTSWIEPFTPYLQQFLDNQREISQQPCSASASLSSESDTAWGDADHIMFIQMELCTGTTLREWIQARTKVAVDEARHICRQLLLAIQHVHDHGFVHNDVKPDNVLICAGDVVKLADFGLSSSSTSGSELVQTGTLSYAAPMPAEDQLSPRSDGPPRLLRQASDMFSVGLCLLECFSTFETAMERAKCFAAAKQRQFSQSLCEQHPDLVSVLSELLSASWATRPSASEVLHRAFFAVPNRAADSSEAIIADLRQQLIDREETIRCLRLLLTQHRTEHLLVPLTH